jgi:hypothetical protein
MMAWNGSAAVAITSEEVCTRLRRTPVMLLGHFYCPEHPCGRFANTTAVSFLFSLAAMVALGNDTIY